MAEKNPDQKFVVYIYDLGGFEKLIGAPNLEFRVFQKMASHQLESLIFNSRIPVLVTGDTSLSIAISAVKSKQLFFYDSPPWKGQLITDLKNSFSNLLDGYEEQKSRLFNLGFNFSRQIFTSAEIEYLVLLTADNEFNRSWNIARKKFLQANDLYETMLKYYRLSKATEGISLAQRLSIVRQEALHVINGQSPFGKASCRKTVSD